MPRRREVPKRKILPDPKYHDLLVAKFINAIMRKGKKGVAERILYRSFDIITENRGELEELPTRFPLKFDLQGRRRWP